MIVWKGRLPGATALGWSASSEKPRPRFCRTLPAAHSPDPKAMNTEEMSDTAIPSATTAV